jgi:hypothetical protein
MELQQELPKSGFGFKRRIGMPTPCSVSLVVPTGRHFVKVLRPATLDDLFRLEKLRARKRR